MKEISILGRKVKMTPCTKERLKGISIGERLSYSFYEASYQDSPLLFLEPKKGNPTPKECRITSDRMTGLFRLPVVFVLKPGPTYERQRLSDKGVYFVMSDQYARLPMLIALEKTSNRKTATALKPVAQYILLYHLQVKSLEGLSAKAISELIPYSYASTALGITCLGDVGLCEKVQAGPKTKTVHFKLKGEELWNAAEPVLISPLEQRSFCDNILAEADFPVCGINALAHYTRLNPDPERMIMLTSKEYRELKASEAFENPNIYDGDFIIEVWRYPAIGLIDEKAQWVDKLSLALVLQDDNDPRVEKEVEQMIKDIQWKD